MIISKDDPGAGARLVKEFAIENEQLVANHSFCWRVEPEADINSMASMPTLDKARAKLLSVLNGRVALLVDGNHLVCWLEFW